MHDCDRHALLVLIEPEGAPRRSHQRQLARKFTALAFAVMAALFLPPLIDSAAGTAARAGRNGSAATGDTDYNVRSFGAKCDGATDDTSGIQSAINAACARSSGRKQAGGAVFFPANVCRHTKPLVIPCSGIEYFGIGRGSQSVLLSDYQGFDTIVYPGRLQGIATGPAIIAGSDAAFSFDNNWYLDLDDTGELDKVNGAANLSIEFFAQVREVGDNQAFIASSGARLPHENVTQAFAIKLFSGRLGCSMNVGGATITATDRATFPIGSVQYVDCDYDGANLKLYRMAPGASAAPVAIAQAHGTVRQSATEDVTAGEIIYNWPDGDILSNPSPGLLMDSIRVSNASRHHGTGIVRAPDAALRSDPASLIVAAASGARVGQNPGGAALQVSSGTGRIGYLVPRRIGSDNLTVHLGIHDLNFSGSAPGSSGIWATELVNSRIENINGNYMRHCIYGFAVNFEDIFANNFCRSDTAKNGRGVAFEMAGPSNSINMWVHNQVVMGTPYGFAQYSDAGLFIQNTCSSGDNTIGCMVLKGSDRFSHYTILDETDDFESVGPVSGLFLGNINSFRMFGGTASALSSSSGAGIPVTIDGGGNYDFFGVEMSCSGDRRPPMNIHIIPGHVPSAVPQITGSFNNMCSPTMSDATIKVDGAFQNHGDSCTQVVTLDRGSGTATAGCFTANDVLSCTDLTSTSGAACSCVPGNRSVVVHGSGSDRCAVVKIQ